MDTDCLAVQAFVRAASPVANRVREPAVMFDHVCEPKWSVIERGPFNCGRNSDCKVAAVVVNLPPRTAVRAETEFRADTVVNDGESVERRVVVPDGDEISEFTASTVQ